MIKTGFIGGGNMAEALIQGMIEKGKRNIMVSDPSAERRQHLEQRYGISSTESNTEVAGNCTIIVLAVKPQNMSAVADEISETVTEDKTVVSIAAGITLPWLESRFSSKRIIRVMPNTPALVQKGMTVMSLCECFSDRDITAVRDIFMSVGEVITLPEKYMNAVTALSGSGPGFFALFVEAMMQAGEAMGLDSDTARTLAVQTAIGTTGLLESGMEPSRLREMVTSPGGTTEAGITSFKENKFMNLVSNAVCAARDRADELGKGRN